MASDQETLHPKSNQTDLAATGRPVRRRIIFLRRRKLPSVRLGGPRPRRRFFLVRLLRKVRLRWLKLHYLRMVKRVKKYYQDLVKDMIEAGATLEAYHERLIMEASTFGAPVMGVSFSSFPYNFGGSDRRPYIM